MLENSPQRDITIWSMNKDAMPSRYHHWRSESGGITFLPQSTKLLSTGDFFGTSHWRIWDVETGEELFHWYHASGIHIRTLDNNRLATVCNSSISLIDLHTLEETKIPIKEPFAVSDYSTCWVESRTTLFWANNNQIRMTNIQNEVPARFYANPDPVKSGPIKLLSFIDAGRMLLASTDHWVRVWSTYTGDMIKLVTRHDEILSVACSPGSSKVIIIGDCGMGQIWDMSHRNPVSYEFNNFHAPTDHSIPFGDKHACQGAALHPKLDVFATICSVDDILQVNVEELSPGGTLYPMKISIVYRNGTPIDTRLSFLTSTSIDMRLSFHPDGRYLCWNNEAWDVSVDPPVEVDSVALSKVLDETFEAVSTPNIVRYRKGDHGFDWIDVGIPTHHSFALPLDFTKAEFPYAMSKDPYRGEAVTMMRNLLALGGDGGRVLTIDFSNLVDDIDPVSPFETVSNDKSSVEGII